MIRIAKEKDIPAIMRLLHQVNNVHAEGRPDLFVKDATKYTPEDVSAIIKDDSTPVFVLTDDSDNLLAYCFCIIQEEKGQRHLHPVRTLYIDDLCVDESGRGKHYGTRLYGYVRDWAKEHGFYNLTLNVWSCNPSALAFYQRMGLVSQKITLETLL